MKHRIIKNVLLIIGILSLGLGFFGSVPLTIQVVAQEGCTGSVCPLRTDGLGFNDDVVVNAAIDSNGKFRGLTDCGTINNDSQTGSASCRGFFVRGLSSGDTFDRDKNYVVIQGGSTGVEFDDYIVYSSSEQLNEFSTNQVYRVQNIKTGNYVEIQDLPARGSIQSEEAWKAEFTEAVKKEVQENQSILTANGAGQITTNTNSDQDQGRQKGAERAADIQRDLINDLRTPGIVCTNLTDSEGAVIVSCKLGDNPVTDLSSVFPTLTECTTGSVKIEEQENGTEKFTCLSQEELDAVANLAANQESTTEDNRNNEGQGKEAMNKLFAILLKIVLMVVGIFLYLVGSVVSFVLFFMTGIALFVVSVNPAGPGFIDVAADAWGIVVGLGNIMILGAFMYVGFGYILGIDSIKGKGGIGDFMLKIAFYALLLNFTLLGTATVINIGQGVGDLMKYSYASTQGEDVNEALAGDLVRSIAQVSKFRCGNYTDGGECTIDSTNAFDIKGIGSILGGFFTDENSTDQSYTLAVVSEAVFVIMGLFAIIVFFRVMYLGLYRITMLWFLMILSPIALAAFFSPIDQFKKIGDTWVQKLIVLIAFYPAFIFALVMITLMSGAFIDIVQGEAVLGATENTGEGNGFGNALEGMVILIISAVVSMMSLHLVNTYFLNSFEKDIGDATNAATSAWKNSVAGAKKFWGATKTVSGAVGTGVRGVGWTAGKLREINALQAAEKAAKKDGREVTAEEKERAKELGENWRKKVNNLSLLTDTPLLLEEGIKGLGKTVKQWDVGSRAERYTALEDFARSNNLMGVTGLRNSDQFQNLAGYGEGDIYNNNKTKDDANPNTNTPLVERIQRQAKDRAEREARGISTKFETVALSYGLDRLKGLRREDLKDTDLDLISQALDDPGARGQIMNDPDLVEKMRGFYDTFSPELQDKVNKDALMLNSNDEYVAQRARQIASTEQDWREFDGANLLDRRIAEAAASFRSPGEIESKTRLSGYSPGIATIQNGDDQTRIKALAEQYVGMGMSKTEANQTASKIVASGSSTFSKNVASGIDEGNIHTRLYEAEATSATDLNQEEKEAEIERFFYEQILGRSVANDILSIDPNSKISGKSIDQYITYLKNTEKKSDAEVVQELEKSQLGQLIKSNQDYQDLTTDDQKLTALSDYLKKHADNRDASRGSYNERVFQRDSKLRAATSRAAKANSSRNTSRKTANELRDTLQKLSDGEALDALQYIDSVRGLGAQEFMDGVRFSVGKSQRFAVKDSRGGSITFDLGTGQMVDAAGGTITPTVSMERDLSKDDIGALQTAIAEVSAEIGSSGLVDPNTVDNYKRQFKGTIAEEFFHRLGSGDLALKSMIEAEARAVADKVERQAVQNGKFNAKLAAEALDRISSKHLDDSGREVKSQTTAQLGQDVNTDTFQSYIDRFGYIG